MLAYHHMRQDVPAAATLSNQHSLLPGPSTCQVDCPKICVSNMQSYGDVAKATYTPLGKDAETMVHSKKTTVVFILLNGLKRRSFSFGSLDTIDSIDKKPAYPIQS